MRYKQLWNYGDKKYVSVDTDGTKGIVGFVPDESVRLGRWGIRIKKNLCRRSDYR
ncbi:hypothetical protein [Parapedobacter pyrenivorans]|uniref:hypothetical protein n=1 Tax=Parapedobacter pyrenivorans TaxID=1305674 RepID=UPI0033424547